MVDYLAALAEHGSYRRTADALKISPGNLQWKILKARAEANTPAPLPKPFTGSLHTIPQEEMPLPAAGKTKTYILTSAQNNTDLHEACWTNLQAIAAHERAEIFVSRTTYATNGRAAAGQKKTSREALAAPEVWDERLTPYMRDRSIRLAPGLVWCGELNILPTAVNPISGMESYTGRDSCIIPHVKFAMRSIPSPKHSGTKLVYTTGAVTLRNYIEKKAGQKASFHHGYGALIVEVCHDGAWFVRQLMADTDGTIYDLDRCVKDGVVTYGHRPEAIVWGDIHTRQLEANVRALAWGAGGILDALKPRRQIMHDVLDQRARNHHDRSDPWKLYSKHVASEGSVSAEVDECAEFLKDATRPWCETVIVAANHDEALIRWLKEADFREDPENAEFILDATAEAYRAMRRGDQQFYPVEWAIRKAAGELENVKFLRRDENYIICPDANDGIELGMHGDKGANGARGNLLGFSRSGRKCIVADSHSAGIQDGAFQVGVMGALDQQYNTGMSSWSHTNAIVYPSGKRSLFTIFGGRWRAAA